MFLGTAYPKLDDKGRLVLPAKYRDGFAAGVVLTKGQEHAVSVWPAATFAEHAERLSEASRSDARVRGYQRVLFTGAFDQVPDRQGRIFVPPALRDYAGLDRDVVFAGNGTICELWTQAAFDDYIARQEVGFAELSEEMVPGL